MKAKLTLFDVISILAALLAAVLLKDYGLLKSELSREIDKLNNTRKANQTVLVFNRTPKAGSESLWKLIDNLAYQNNFTSMSDDQANKKIRGENTYLQTASSREYYVTGLLDQPNSTKPVTYTKHINFLNFEEFGYTNPIYINMVRHPIERIVSWYYYIRQAWYILEWDEDKQEHKLNSRKFQNPHMFKTSFEDCWNDQLPECRYHLNQSTHSAYGGAHQSQIAFFCGMDPICDIFGSREAMELAKRNVEKYYSVVGVLELWNESLRVFEEFVPYFFRGLPQAYIDFMRGKPKNENKTKPKTPKHIKQMLATNFTVEIEFYEFCKQRLYRQYMAIK